MSNSNREAVVKPRSGYSRETSGKFFSSKSALQIGSVHGIMRETPDNLSLLYENRRNVRASNPTFRTVEARCLKY